jgi:tetrahedral aminopeptidase
MSSKPNIDLLEKLCQTPGIPGREQPIIDIMQSELKGCCDEIKVDNLGNIFGIKRTSKKNPLKVMIAGHMDEIGFIVSHIDEKTGFIRFSPRGGHLPRVLIHQRVRVYGKGNKEHKGIVETSPLFLDLDNAKKAPEFKAMYIDLGLSASEVKRSISVGDVIVTDGDFLNFKESCVSKAFDNRVGCYIVLEVMKKLKSKRLDVEVVALGSAQEEVGIRGAWAAGVDQRPDMGIALDVTAAFDVPGVSPDQQVTKLGGGIAIKINDQATISNHGIVKKFTQLAKSAKINYQYEVLPFGGTDAAGFQRSGAAVCTLSVPTRYVHSPNEMINKKDLQAGVDLLVKFLEQAHKVKLEF